MQAPPSLREVTAASHLTTAMIQISLDKLIAGQKTDLNPIEELVTESDIEERIKYGQWGEAFSRNFDTTDRTLIDTPEKLRALLPSSSS